MTISIRESVARMQGYVPGEQPRTGGFIKLNTNENPYPPSPAVARALQTLDPADLRLYPDPACTVLRRAIADLHRCDPVRVLAGNGLDELLSLCVRAFVPDGGSVGFMDPSYSLYPVLADIRGLSKRPVALGARYEWNMPAGYTASLFILTHPNAPTGLCYDRASVLGFCRSFAGVVVIDEAYVDFADRDCLDFALSEPNVLVARTLSKSYSLAGLRVGYLVGPDPLIATLDKIKDSYNLDRVAQCLATAAVNDQAWMLANVRRIRDTRARLQEQLVKRGWEVFPSQSNFIWTRPAGKTADAWTMALKDRQILVRYFRGPRTSDCLRITVGTDEETDRLLTVLDELASGGTTR